MHAKKKEIIMNVDEIQNTTIQLNTHYLQDWNLLKKGEYETIVKWSAAKMRELMKTPKAKTYTVRSNSTWKTNEVWKKNQDKKAEEHATIGKTYLGNSLANVELLNSPLNLNCLLLWKKTA